MEKESPLLKEARRVNSNFQELQRAAKKAKNENPRLYESLLVEMADLQVRANHMISRMSMKEKCLMLKIATHDFKSLRKIREQDKRKKRKHKRYLEKKKKK